jgi:hypothetical protein
MAAFAVMRHTETGGVGTVPADAVDLHRANGWVRVSDYRAEPSAFHIPDFADAPDLDASETTPEQEPDQAPATTTEKESTE